MAVLMPTSGGQMSNVSRQMWPFNDPVLLRDDRVVRTMIKKEEKYLPYTRNYFAEIQTDLNAIMRKEVCDWMLEICEVRSCSPEVFTLAMNYLDRFLSICRITRSQLQLLGAVSLMVAWKVYEGETLPASKLVEYSDFTLNAADITEWEVLLLSKLDWDVSAVTAFDFLEHIIQRVDRFQSHGTNLDIIRRQSEALITLCSASYQFISTSPCLIASACVLTAVRPHIEDNLASSSASMGQSSPTCSLLGLRITTEPTNLNGMENVLNEIERLTRYPKSLIVGCVHQVEDMLHSCFTESPIAAPIPESQQMSSQKARGSGELPVPRRRLFQSGSSPEQSTSTPTKVLDIAKDY